MADITKSAAYEIAARRAEILQRMKRMIIERLTLPLSSDDITEDGPLFGAGLGLDSVDALELAVGVEAEFGVQISNEDMPNLRSLNTVADLIEKYQAEAK